MPKLWHHTIAAHRDAVRGATLDKAADLLARHGLRGVTMSEIAEEAGISRATLYKYFADVEAVLVALHERQIAGHIAELTTIRDRARGPGERVAGVLEAYAGFQHQHQGSHAMVLEHGVEHVARVKAHLIAFVGALIQAAATAGEARDDVPPDELAAYCLGALDAAADLPSKAAVSRLIEVTLTGLRPAWVTGRGAPDRR